MTKDVVISQELKLNRRVDKTGTAVTNTTSHSVVPWIATQAKGGMWDGQRQTTGTGTLLSYRLSGTSAAHMASKLEMLDRHDIAI